MALLRNHLLYGLALALLPAAPLMAQDRAPAPDQGETSDNEIIVEGYTEKEVRHFLWREVIETGRVIAKRTEAVCIGIDNAPPELSDPLRQRIEGNLRSLDIEVGDSDCKPNALIAFTDDAHRFVTWLDKAKGGAVYGSLYLPEKRRLIDPVRPVYNWHVTNLRDLERFLGTGQPLSRQGASGDRGFQATGFSPGGRILEGITPAETSMTFSVIDYDSIDGITVEQLGDYLTMQMLVEFRPDRKGTVPKDSILNLFDRDGSDPDAPPEMSQLDRIVLSEIYGARLSYRPGAIRASIARRAVNRLEEDGALRARP